MQTKVIEKLQQVAPEAQSKGSVTVTLTAPELEDLMKQLKHPASSVLRARRVGMTSKPKKFMLSDDECYSVAEVAQRFNVTPQAVYKWIQERKIVFYEPSPGGRGYRIPKGQFQEKVLRRNEFIQRRKQLLAGVKSPLKIRKLYFVTTRDPNDKSANDHPIPNGTQEGPLIRILWDTNVFVSAFLFGSVPLLDYLDDLMDQQLHGFMELLVPKAVQAEFYAILRAGSVMKNKRPLFVTHEEIVDFLGPYLDLFDRDYLTFLNTVAWPQGDYYKEVYRQLIEEEYGWPDFGQAFIESRLRHPVQILGIKGDPYDYPVMATALLFGVDLIVTSNMRDFIDPFGKIRVMTPNDARNFDHYSLHMPHDYFSEDDA